MKQLLGGMTNGRKFFELSGDIINGTGRVISAIHEAVEILNNDDGER